MRKALLGKSGLEVSAVGFGGIPIMRVGTKDAITVIGRAIELGVNFIDTAMAYGDSQAKIGAAIADRREGLILATKSGKTTKEEILDDVERARSQMGVDVIDLYQLHSVSSEENMSAVLETDGALAGLIEARRAGHIAHIGVTSHSLEVALKLLDVDEFETLQFPFNLVTSEPADELIPKARDRNVGFIVMKPMCGGQYDNPELAFKFLNGYPDLVAIPGIEAAWEIEQIVELVESGATLSESEAVEAQAIADMLGKLFCRRCGYCMPCPEGVPIGLAMVFDSFVKRFPPDVLIERFGRRVAEDGAKCIECGKCEAKCPYNLPIIDTIKQSVAKARKIMAEQEAAS